MDMSRAGRAASAPSEIPSMLFVSSSKPRGLVEYALWKSSESSVPAGVGGCWIGEGALALKGVVESLEDTSAGANLVRGVSGEGNSVRCGLIGGWVRRAGRFKRGGRLGAINAAS